VVLSLRLSHARHFHRQCQMLSVVVGGGGRRARYTYTHRNSLDLLILNGLITPRLSPFIAANTKPSSSAIALFRVAPTCGSFHLSRGLKPNQCRESFYGASEGKLFMKRPIRGGLINKNLIENYGKAARASERRRNHKFVLDE
jgi:hypothetical protein